ncbi:hypothetical protein C5Y97_10035 [Blastopirellula marina]|uniref:Uncharacterized protein n=1 Tax=Blastopirellula marina TaxID=124 RepID=A0A2S8G2A3_9BACT|nr:hypothetical protein C5Y98_10025 [Blastopirellula marina]PTL45048.1 hypothetical protein C5Y97_10035 [Blastopirellula marina]
MSSLVFQKSIPGGSPNGKLKMARNRKSRRQQHGSAWHWMPENCWCDTLPGTKKWMPISSASSKDSRALACERSCPTWLWLPGSSQRFQVGKQIRQFFV